MKKTAPVLLYDAHDAGFENGQSVRKTKITIMSENLP